MAIYETTVFCVLLLLPGEYGFIVNELSNHNTTSTTFSDRLRYLEKYVNALTEELIAERKERQMLQQEMQLLHHKTNRSDISIQDIKTQLHLAVLSIVDLDSKETNDVKRVTDHLAQLQKNITQDFLQQTSNISNISAALYDLKNPVAFFAYLTTNLYVRSGHQTIVYDAVRTNNGGGYNVTNGVFKAPSDGVYVFTWTTLTGSGEYLRLEIVVAGSVYLGTISHTSSSSNADTETGIIVAEIRAHETVYIRSRSISYGSGNYLWYDYSSYASSFVGWKIN